jgi:hypothetical protein
VWRSILQLQEKVNQLEKWRQQEEELTRNATPRDVKICVQSEKAKGRIPPPTGLEK